MSSVQDLKQENPVQVSEQEVTNETSRSLKSALDDDEPTTIEPVKSEKEDEKDADVPPVLPPKTMRAALDDDDDVPPQKPSRPATKTPSTVRLSPIDEVIAELTEMFPTTDVKYIKMALIASEGRLEPASNALLFLSDPESGIEIPQQQQQQFVQTPANIQLQRDEELARKLAKSYQKRSTPQIPSKSSHGRAPGSKNNNVHDFGYQDSDDDDIIENINKNLNEAKDAIGGWFDNVAKKFQEVVVQPNAQQQKTNTNRQYNDESNYRPQARTRNSNPYQTLPKEVQRGYSANGRGYNDDSDPFETAPKLPTRKNTNNLYSAVNPSDQSLNDQKITLSSNIENTNDADDIYSIPASSSKEKSPLTETDPVPLDDAFTVEDSEDDEEVEKLLAKSSK